VVFPHIQYSTSTHHTNPHAVCARAAASCLCAP
jgi:hypothetical protein